MPSRQLNVSVTPGPDSHVKLTFVPRRILRLRSRTVFMWSLASVTTSPYFTEPDFRMMHWEDDISEYIAGTAEQPRTELRREFRIRPTYHRYQ